MRLLLDTHALLWWLDGDRRLSLKARRAIANQSNTILVSAASAWFNQSRSTRTSSSVVTTICPRAARIPAFSAGLRPCSRSKTYRRSTG